MVRLLLFVLLPAVICLLHTPGSGARKSDLRTVFVCVPSLEIPSMLPCFMGANVRAIRRDHFHVDFCPPG